ncbi:hypothetical protein V1478_014646 [Vespula squamosa]|uniref:Uncharacterized protein n=1 Tax=Vespula squamosa TaxID=30214 RepID=A0ABD2A2T9_VESSQ
MRFLVGTDGGTREQRKMEVERRGGGVAASCKTRALDKLRLVPFVRSRSLSVQAERPWPSLRSIHIKASTELEGSHHAAHLEIYPLIYTVRHGLDVTEESLLEEEEERRGAR